MQSRPEREKVDWRPIPHAMKQPNQPPLLYFEPTEADIQKCAYLLWQEEGRPTGRDLDLWLAAKELVRHHVTGPRPDRTARRPDPGPGAPRRRLGA